MRKALLIIGIIILIFCVLSLLYGFLNMSAYKNLFDASPEHYRNLHRKMTLFLSLGVSFGVIGAICLIIQSRLK